MCRWGWSHPPGARSHQLPAFTITAFSISQCHKRGLCLPFHQCNQGFRLWYLQGFGEAPVSLLFAISEAAQPVEPLLQLPQLASWATHSIHVLQASSTFKLGPWRAVAGVSAVPGCRTASACRSSLSPEVSDVPGVDGPGDHALMHVMTTAKDADAVLSGDAHPLCVLSSKYCCVWEQTSQIRKRSLIFNFALDL